MSFVESSGNISDAVRLDISDRDLFGRDAEVKVLQDALKRISDGKGKSEVVLVRGVSGTGKSSLVKVALKDFTRHDKGGLFVRGKFDQFCSDGSDSYAALLEAFNDLCKLVDEHKDRDVLVGSTREALGEKARQLSTFIPGIRDLLLDDGDERKNDRNDEMVKENTLSYNLFVAICCKLIRSLASIETPIVFFVDDLQWSNSDSLKLIHALLVDEEMKGLLIVGAYRDDEVDDDHQLSVALKRIAAKKVPISTVNVGCLDEATVNKLVAYATDSPIQDTAELSQLIHRKTFGNGLFVAQFLALLQDDRLLRYSFKTYRWEWEIDNIAAKTNISENVVDIVVERIGKLDPKSQEIFKIAGCLGPQFTIDILNIISRNMAEAMPPIAEYAADDFTIAYSSTKMAVAKLLSMNLLEPSRGAWIKFSHDRIQQAAESWVPHEHEKLELRLKIGRILKSHTQSDGAKNDDWLFFTSIDLLNKGSALISEENEKVEVVRLNWLAARKATERSAFLPAASYSEAAILLLGKHSWVDDHDFTMHLHGSAAESYRMCGRSEKSFELAKEMIAHSTSSRERLRGRLIQLESVEQLRLFEKGKELGLATLGSLGVRFPRKPNKFHVIKGFLQTKRLLQRYTDEELLNFPAMTDETELMISKINYSVIRILFFARDKDVLPLLWFRSIQKAIQFGISPYVCGDIVSFGNVLGQVDDIKGATRFGRLSLLMCEKFGTEQIVPAMHLSYYYMSHHWKNPFASVIDPLVNAYAHGMKVGDIQYALMSGLGYCASYLFTGLNLAILESDLRKFITVVETYNLTVAFEQAVSGYQLVLLLTGTDALVSNPLELTGSAINEYQFLQQLRDSGSGRAEFVCRAFKLRALVFLGSHQEDTLREYRTIRSKYFDKELTRADFGGRQDDFYGALAAIAVFKRAGKRRYLRLAKRLMRQMKKLVKDGAINCVHMLQLLNAEILSTKKVSTASLAIHRQEVKRAFDVAIGSARRSGFNQDGGLANEKAAAFHANFDEEYANDYLRKAFAKYVDWGAKRKLELMAALHPCLQPKGRSSTYGSSYSSGRMNARSRYEDNATQQHSSLHCW